MISTDTTTTSATPIPVPSLHEPSLTASVTLASPSSASSSSNESPHSSNRLQRPKLGSRKSSGTMIVPRDSPRAETYESDEEYDEGDVRSMSPRRSVETVERLGRDARQSLIEQAKQLQASLLAIVDRVETVKEEHEKLEGGNKFLQSYIGELIQTSKITSSKGKGRNAK